MRDGDTAGVQQSGRVGNGENWLQRRRPADVQVRPMTREEERERERGRVTTRPSPFAHPPFLYLFLNRSSYRVRIMEFSVSIIRNLTLDFRREDVLRY